MSQSYSVTIPLISNDETSSQSPPSQGSYSDNDTESQVDEYGDEEGPIDQYQWA